ncbi:uncharacterized protein LOC128395375 [Panonychus citri]|uniref:uncharacterized protein LOC128395375 n=1 Tax=Panonychus citri TaxID=50023 RepID=UPI002307871C|nr:uncharacterized protein LOC128395375 [Panonychus citri]
MFLNDLPDECLYLIFKRINGLDDLINCGEVCSRWNYLINRRLFHVKYLTGVPSSSYSVDTIYFGESDALKDINFWQLLPNVKILDVPRKNEFNYEDLVNILTKSKSIKGLIYHPVLTKVLARYCGNLEMIATRYSKIYFTDIIINCGTKLKQLYIWYLSFRHLERFVRHLPNLQRLHINDTTGETNYIYNGSMLENLKILEISLEPFDRLNIYAGFHLIDFCPSLVSAYFNVHGSNGVFFDESVKNYCLRDLVIQYTVYDCSHNWISLRNFLTKFPNLRHLAVRGNQNLQDDHISELITFLPHLIILDLRSCYGVTQQSADDIVDYCKKNKRFISIYTKSDQPINLDWPELSDCDSRICSTFDFMRNCFLKSFDQLPLLMDSFS